MTTIPAPILASNCVSRPPAVFVMWIPSMRLVVPDPGGKKTAEQFGCTPIVQKSLAGQGLFVALRVVATGPSSEMISTPAGTRIASR
jgi:hypothetical protein